MKLLLTLLLLTSCGSQSSSDSPAVDTSSQKKASENKPNISTSYYVKSAADLRACDDTSRGFLAYVKDIDQFEACLDSGWTTVNVRGKDGASGTSGTNGTNGTPVSPNQWYDAISQKMWVMTTIITGNTGWNDNNSACISTGYRMPSQAEIVAALTHGMKAAAQALPSPPAQILASGGSVYNVTDGSLAGTGQGAQFCIAK